MDHGRVPSLVASGGVIMAMSKWRSRSNQALIRTMDWVSCAVIGLQEDAT